MVQCIHDLSALTIEMNWNINCVGNVIALPLEIDNDYMQEIGLNSRVGI